MLDTFDFIDIFLNHGGAAVHHHGLTGHEGGVIAGKEAHCAHHILRRLVAWNPMTGIARESERMALLVDDLLLLSRTWSTTLPDSGSGDLVAAIQGVR